MKTIVLLLGINLFQLFDSSFTLKCENGDSNSEYFRETDGYNRSKSDGLIERQFLLTNFHSKRLISYPDF